MKVLRPFIVLLILATEILAGEVLQYLDVDGHHYESVKWGTVNQGKVVIFHSRGVAYIPLEKLPPEYQARFGYKPDASSPSPSPTPEPPAIPEPPLRRTRHAEQQNTGEWAAYNRDRAAKVILGEQLVQKSTLTELTGFLVKEAVTLRAADPIVQGAILELAIRRDPSERVASSMELRPALWQGTGEQVLLANYSPTAIVGALLRVYVVEDTKIDARRVFRVGAEPTFEQWQTLSSRKN